MHGDEFPRYEVEEDGLLVSTDRARLDFDVIHGYLTESYWSAGISLDQVRRQTQHSLPFGLYEDGDMLGFGRVISDFTRWAYLCDFFVVPGRQGAGLGKHLMRVMMAHPELSDVRRWVLLTKDAHGLYEQFGFTALGKPHIYMENKQGRASGKWK
jgi:predicted N-acetyltransferase YhbS